MSLPDVVAMKLSAITNRGAQKDFYDLHTLIVKLGLSAPVRMLPARSILEHDPMMLLRSLTYFADAMKAKTPKSLIGVTWPKVKSSIERAVKAALK